VKFQVREQFFGNFFRLNVDNVDAAEHNDGYNIWMNGVLPVTGRLQIIQNFPCF